MLCGPARYNPHMFIRTLARRTTRNHAVQILESYRDAQGRPRQRILRHVGTAQPGPALDALLAVAELEKARLLEARRPALFPPATLAERAMAARQRRWKEEAPLPIRDARQLEEEERVILGFHEVFGQLYAEWGLSGVWSRRHRVSEPVFRQAVLLRLAAPGRSKRALAARSGRDYGMEVPLERIYRMMDRLDGARIEALTERIGAVSRGLPGSRLEVVFCDVTTLAFCSERDDELRRKGYSKDGKPHRVQVVLVLLQTAEGLPVGYRLFPGNTAEVKTLVPLVEELRERYELGRVVVVTDSGLLSGENLSALESAGFEWVVAARLRRLGAEDLAELSPGASGWESCESGGEEAPEGVGRGPRIRELVLTQGAMKGRRLVVTWNPKKARRDARQRAEAVAKAKKRVKAAATGKGRPARFLRVRRGAMTFDQEAEHRDALFDGLHGVLTSLPDPAPAIRAHYAELWWIEEGFRVLKSTVKTRPVFHWTERRVRAHVAICYTAFALLRMLRHRFRLHHPSHPAPGEDRILDELARVQSSLLRDHHNDFRYFLPSGRTTREQRMLYSTVGLSLPTRATLASTPADSDP